MLRKTILGVALVAMAGCGAARLITRDQYGGVIALDGDRQKAMEDASKMMAANCGGPYTIVSEGEQVVGSDTTHTDQTYTPKDGKVVNQGGESTRNVTEWRVRYQCGAGQGMPPGAPPAYPDPNAPPPPPPPQ